MPLATAVQHVRERKSDFRCVEVKYADQVQSPGQLSVGCLALLLSSLLHLHSADACLRVGYKHRVLSSAFDTPQLERTLKGQG